MISIYDWLRKYFIYPENFHPQFGSPFDRIRDNQLPAHTEPRYTYSDLGWKASLGLDYADKNFRHLVLYVPDREIVKDRPTRPTTALINLPDMNYVLYGMYMNLIAHLQGYQKVKLELIQSCEPEKNHIISYRSEIARYLIDFRIQELEKEKAEKQKASLQTAGPAEKTGSFTPLFG